MLQENQIMKMEGFKSLLNGGSDMLNKISPEQIQQFLALFGG